MEYEYIVIIVMGSKDTKILDSLILALQLLLWVYYYVFEVVHIHS